MINIEQITARLAKLPDQALQQYAMMHKEDPYIMALAVSESNRRKQIRAAGQGQAQEQPKVADQALMDMAPQQAPQQSPDEAGIAGLAAGDMNFADGGIVAFAGGGDVEHYADAGMVRLPNESFADFRRRMFDMELKRQRESNLATEQAREAERARLLAARSDSTMIPPSPFFDRAPLPNPNGTAVPTMPAPGYTRPAMANDPRLATPVTEPISAAADLAGTQQGLGGTKEAAALRGAKPMGTTPAATTAAAPSIDDAKTQAGKFLDTKAAEGQYNKFLDEEKAEITKQRAEFDKGKPTGKAYSKYEEMLAKEEAGAGKEKDEALGLAIFKAGLGMMSGSSPHAFENIGKGAMAGLDDYSSAMKDMKKAARERQKAMADIDNARRAEERDDWKSARDFDNKASERLSKAREFGIRGIMDITGKSAEIASGIYKTQVTESGQDRRAKLQADTTLAAARMRTDASGAAGGDKQQLAQLKALQSHYADQIKTTYNKADRARLQTKLDAVESAIAKMAGLDTILSAPGAASPGGTRPPLSSFQR